MKLSVLKIMDVVELVLTLIAIILLMFLFYFEKTSLKYVFIVLGVILICSFTKIISKVENVILSR